jgi:hypothetical protein
MPGQNDTLQTSLKKALVNYYLQKNIVGSFGSQYIDELGPEEPLFFLQISPFWGITITTVL